MEKRTEVISTHFDSATRIFGMTCKAGKISLEDLKEIITQIGKSKNMPYALEIMEL